MYNIFSHFYFDISLISFESVSRGSLHTLSCCYLVSHLNSWFYSGITIKKENEIYYDLGLFLNANASPWILMTTSDTTINQ